ncbi:MAG: ComEC/Rec2 family competence protein, partial [Acidimicrobiia bacterium]|nr:ComEC/Rec2 family competence protein [Acidimicrobiia bacterium]
RFVGLPLSPAVALAVVAGGSVLVEPALADSVGFRLSVAASIGLIAGARWVTARHPVMRLFVATVCAQLAVAPVLLATFGSVPLLSPVANLAAIPLVAVATVLGGIGAALGSQTLIGVASGLAAVVIGVARVAAPWPHLGWVGFGVAVVVGAVCWRVPSLRIWGAATALVVLIAALAPDGDLPGRGVVFLDVGQGDAVVVHVDGFVVLVDGGPDPTVLLSALDRFGIDAIDLMVATHVHADHVAGLAGMIGRIPVGQVWAAFEPHETPSSRRLIEAARAHGIPLLRPAVGDRIAVGEDWLRVLGPERRYAGPNDQSLVIEARIAGKSVLRAGDIETVAQRELEVGHVDVLKVPHQGAATSLPTWLRRHAGQVAVISVGPNDFGHPADWVISELVAAGSQVQRTDLEGDIVLDFESELTGASEGRSAP